MRETETWMPMKTTQTATMLTHDDTESSGSDFGFTDDEDGEGDQHSDTLYDEDEDDYEDDYEDEEEFSGSGDRG